MNFIVIILENDAKYTFMTVYFLATKLSNKDWNMISQSYVAVVHFDVLDSQFYVLKMLKISMSLSLAQRWKHTDRSGSEVRSEEGVFRQTQFHSATRRHPLI